MTKESWMSSYAVLVEAERRLASWVESL